MVSLFLFLQLFMSPKGDTYPFDKWTEAELNAANTAKDCAYLSDEEKEVFQLCNLARINGKLFAETYVAKYLKENEVKKTSYTTSLLSELKKLKPLAPLHPAKDLYDAAKDHAITEGKKGAVGHQRFKQRFKKFAPGYNPYGENCSYGFSDALNIVMQLLIDEGIKDKGHRKNILHKMYTHAGVAIAPHKRYTNHCVIDYGKK